MANDLFKNQARQDTTKQADKNQTKAKRTPTESSALLSAYIGGGISIEHEASA